MQLLLARHGNTFAPGEQVVWVGRNQDLVLVERGREQAVDLAVALEKAGKVPLEIRCGPLARTREFAEIVGERLGTSSIRVEERLDELDYGCWSGLSRAEIVQRFGGDELDAWSERSEWPQHARWSSDRQSVVDEVRSLAAELRVLGSDARGDASVLLVSSNGRLRYFLDLVPGEFERRVAKREFAVATGCVGRIDLSRDACTASALRYWNRDPRTLSSL